MTTFAYKRSPRYPALLAALAAVLATRTLTHAAVTVATVTVGNAGNAADARVMNDGTTGRGRVAYAYNVGKYEVTAAQYAAFLNSVAATDTYGLYNTAMAGDEAGCQIVRSGTSGNYTYGVAGDYANRPVNYVSYGDTLRFANWLANGQPTGTQTAGTTETGSYTLNGATDAASLLNVARNAAATWVVTSEDEWYKAAFYDPATGTYTEYATNSNTLPSNVLSASTGNNANYRDANDADTLGGPYYRTEAGAFADSESAYGTFDQNGNVWEWNESTVYGLFKGLRGGAIGSYSDTLSASFNYFDAADSESNSVGFRVATTVVPEPAALAAFGLAAAAGLRRRRE